MTYEFSKLVKAAVARLRRATDVLGRHADELEDAGIRPTVLRDVVLVKPWTTDELATALGISADNATDLLIGMGLDQDTQGRWWLSDDEVTVAVIEHVLQIACGYHAATGRRDELTLLYRAYLDELRRNG